jgi:hypothetical protein
MHDLGGFFEGLSQGQRHDYASRYRAQATHEPAPRDVPNIRGNAARFVIRIWHTSVQRRRSSVSRTTREETGQKHKAHDSLRPHHRPPFMKPGRACPGRRLRLHHTNQVAEAQSTPRSAAAGTGPDACVAFANRRRRGCRARRQRASVAKPDRLLNSRPPAPLFLSTHDERPNRPPRRQPARGKRDSQEATIP